MREVDRVQLSFVADGPESVLGGRQGLLSSLVYKANEEFKVHLAALSCGKQPDGHALWSLRLPSDSIMEPG